MHQNFILYVKHVIPTVIVSCRTINFDLVTHIRPIEFYHLIEMHLVHIEVSLRITCLIIKNIKNINKPHATFTYKVLTRNRDFYLNNT